MGGPATVAGCIMVGVPGGWCWSDLCWGMLGTATGERGRSGEVDIIIIMIKHYIKNEDKVIVLLTFTWSVGLRLADRHVRHLNLVHSRRLEGGEGPQGRADEESSHGRRC